MTKEYIKKSRTVLLWALLAISLIVNIVLWDEKEKGNRYSGTTTAVNYTVQYDTTSDIMPKADGEKSVGMVAVAKSDLKKKQGGNVLPNTTDDNFVPIFANSEQISKDTVSPNNADDSLYLPLTQKVYHKDSCYTAWVSGYHPNLDSIHVFNKTIIKTVTITKTKKERRFGVGLQAGYGIGKNGAMPYIGVGVQYRLFGF